MEGIQRDSEKISSILTSMLQPNHPYHGFSCGNRESLVVNPKKQNIDTLAELRKFYDKYYSANLMCLCVSQALHVARANRNLPTTYRLLSSDFKNFHISKDKECFLFDSLPIATSLVKSVSTLFSDFQLTSSEKARENDKSV